VPTQPMVMRSLGATAPSLPSALEGTMYGNATAPTAAAEACFKNCRRDDVDFFTRMLLMLCASVGVDHVQIGAKAPI
jgi:hypothetical protein